MKNQGNRSFDAAKDTRWRGVISEFSGSGLSVRKFCRRNQIREESFFSWRKTLHQRDSQAGGQQTLASAGTVQLASRGRRSPSRRPQRFWLRAQRAERSHCWHRSS